MTKTDEGYLVGKAIFTRTGIFKYQRADGSSYNELRTSDEVFNQDSINSFKLKPITNNHPQETVNADNIGKYQVGHIGEDLKQDGDKLVGSIMITDSQTIKDIQNGKRELSLGYKVALVKEDGQFKGQAYEFKQTNIRGNHLAIVYQGRAGHQARLNLDSQDAVCVNINNNNNNNMSEKDNSKELQEKLDTLETNKKSLTDKVGELSIKCDVLEGERDALKIKLDEALKVDHSEELANLVKSRVELEKTAEKILKKDLSDKVDNDIMSEVILSQAPDLKLDGKSDEYLKACFDSCVSLRGKENLDKQKELFKGDSVKQDSKIELSQSDIINNRTKGIK
tara:strand:+ start:835 stop:1848 length:1014 start_codon:yes stop_codon:yes gene_type:complete